MITIKRKKSQIIINIVLAIGFIALYIFQLLEQDSIKWYRHIALLCIGIIYLYWAYKALKTPFLEINETSLTYYNLQQTYKFNLAELKEIRTSAGDYVFQPVDGKKSLRITKSQINEDQLKEFEAVIEDLKSKLKNVELN